MRISYTKPIYKDNKLVAVLAVDLFFSDYVKMINGNIMVIDVKNSDIFSRINNLQKVIIGLALFLTIIFSLIGWWISKKISRAIILTTRLVTRTADFDLSGDDSCDHLLKSKDEVGQLVNAFILIRQN